MSFLLFYCHSFLSYPYNSFVFTAHHLVWLLRGCYWFLHVYMLLRLLSMTTSPDVGRFRQYSHLLTRGGFAHFKMFHLSVYACTCISIAYRIQNWDFVNGHLSPGLRSIFCCCPPSDTAHLARHAGLDMVVCTGVSNSNPPGTRPTVPVAPYTVSPRQISAHFIPGKSIFCAHCPVHLS